MSSRIHGHRPRGGYSPTYISWKSMRQRCEYEEHDSYKSYGGRGIRIHPRWARFENFLQDMGDRPDGHTLDRINSDGHYGPGNCRWATPSEQARNRKTTRLLTFTGRTMTLSEWAHEIGIRPASLAKRLEKMCLTRALTTPINKVKQRAGRGKR